MESTRNHNAVEKPPRLKRFKRVGRSVAALSVPPLTLLTAIVGVDMKDREDLSPLESLGNAVAFVRSTFGEELCPPSPENDVLNQHRSHIENVLHHPDVWAVQAEAETQGLTFADATPVIEQVWTAESAQHATDIVDNYLRESFGFKLDLEIPSDLINSEAEINNYIVQLESFITTLSMFPAELLARSGVGRITITTLLDKTDGERKAVYRVHRQEAIFDIGHFHRPSLIIHEVLGHGAHAESCDGYAGRDTAITDLNPEGYSYTSSTAVSFKKAHDSSINTTQYGQTNNREDVAEIVEVFLTGDQYQEMLAFDPDSPAGQKLKVILSRFDKLAPNSAEYLAHIRGVITELEYWSSYFKYDYTSDE